MVDGEGSDVDAREQLAREPGMRVHRARRSPARLPAGTWPKREGLMKDGRPTDDPIREGCIRVSEVQPLSEVEKGCIELLEHDFFAPLRAGLAFGAIRDEDRLALHATVEQRFGCSLATALWLVACMTELEFGRGERFELERCAADPNAVDLLSLANTVLQRTRLALARTATFRPMLPSYVSTELTALFLKRFPYTRGGGPLASLSEDRIRKLLREPKALARYLRTSPRLAKRFVRELTELDLVIGAARDDRESQKC